MSTCDIRAATSYTVCLHWPPPATLRAYAGLHQLHCVLTLASTNYTACLRWPPPATLRAYAGLHQLHCVLTLASTSYTAYLHWPPPVTLSAYTGLHQLHCVLTLASTSYTVCLHWPPLLRQRSLDAFLSNKQHILLQRRVQSQDFAVIQNFWVWSETWHGITTMKLEIKVKRLLRETNFSASQK